MTGQTRVLPHIDADPATVVLRAPAAAIAAAYVVGLFYGVAARPLSAPGWSAVLVLFTVLVCGPFLMPARWFRRQPSLLWGWMLAAALMATTRAVAMAVWLFSRLPLDAWLVKTVVDLVVCSLLWVAAVAVWRAGRAAFPG